MMEARLAKPEEAQLAVEWLVSTPENMFQPEVLGYPGTMTLCVEDNGNPLLFMPLQLCMYASDEDTLLKPCFFMDALGKKPNIRKREMAVSLVKMIEATRNIANGMGIREVFFFCREATVKEQAINFGFEIISEDKDRNITLFRMKQNETTH